MAAPSHKCSCLLPSCEDCTAKGPGSDRQAQGRDLRMATPSRSRASARQRRGGNNGRGRLNALPQQGPVPLVLLQPSANAYSPLASLEQPASSMMWLLEGVQAWQRAVGGQTVLTAYCMFGAAWQKRTKIHFSSTGFTPLVKMCRRSYGHKHVQLSGWNDGRFTTSLASPYPEAGRDVNKRKQAIGCG